MKKPVKETFLPNILFYSNRIMIFLFIYLAFGFLGVNAAVVVDNSSSQGMFNAGGVTSLTFSHPIGMGTSRALFVGVSTFTSTIPIGGIPTQRVESVTFNGILLTGIGTQNSPGALPTNSVEVFRLISPMTSPPNTPGTIVVTFSNVLGNPFVNYGFASAVSFTGVEQITPNGAFFSLPGTNTNPSVTVTDSASGDLVFDTVSSTFDADSFDEGTNQIVCTDDMDENTCRRGRRFFGGLSDIGATSLKNENGSSVLMSWTLEDPEDWAIGAFAIKAVPASAASGTINGRVLASNGRGVGRAVVSVTGSDGEIFTAQTNSFGYYRFNEIPFGETYIVQVNSKKYSFAPQIITFNENINELNLVAIEN